LLEIAQRDLREALDYIDCYRNNFWRAPAHALGGVDSGENGLVVGKT
jgi:hypothetical protein